MKTILKVKGLNKSFDQTKVLKDINLNVRAGEFIAIMGPSGSGKSTLLYNISGMDKPSSGTVVFNNQDFATLDDDEMSEIRLNQMGFIFQHSYLLKNLSIQDNIVLPGFKAGKLSREEVHQNALQLMEKTGIAHVADHDIKKVSGGQLQRAAICRALINQPGIIFGDEPTGALNSSATKEIMDILNGINLGGTVVIIVTHDAKVASRAERIIFLMDGNIKNEFAMDKYDLAEADQSVREKKLSDWLSEQGL